MSTLYKYSFIHAIEGTHNVVYAPQEWAEDQAFWERSTMYWGVFRSFSTKELSFIKTDAAWLKVIFDTYGTEAECSFKVEFLNTVNYTYETLYSGIIDFSTYKHVDGNTGEYVKVQIIDDSFTNTVKTREDVDVNLAKLFDLNGDAITPFTHEGIPISVPAKYFIFNAELGHFTSKTTTHAVLLTVVSKDEESIMDVQDETAYTSKEGAFFSPKYVTDLDTHIHATGTAVLSTAGSVSIDLKRYSSSGVLQFTRNVDSQSLGAAGTITFAVNGDFAVHSCNVDDYVVLVMTITGTCTTMSVIFDLFATYNKLMYGAYSMSGYPYHEAFTRILQAITGQANPFYSSILGRTDSEITTYAADGDLSLGILTNGLLIRGFVLTDQDVALNANIKNLFNSLSALRPLCLGIETISSVQKVRVETLRYAFDEHIFMTLENVANITEEVAFDLTYSALAIGFSKADESYHGEVGRYEANQTSKYATCLTRQSNEFSKVAPYRGDNNGISLAREKNIGATASEDTSYDDANFIVSFVRGTPNAIKTDQGYDSITNVNDPANTYNVDYSPARSLRNWGSFIRGCLEKYASTILSFSKSDKNSTMTSKKTAESFTVYEGADITVSDLDDPFFENIYYSFDCVVTNQMIEIMNSMLSSKPAPYYIVKFRGNSEDSYRYGWIMKFESRKPDNKGLGAFKLLKVNTTYVTPTALQLFSINTNSLDFLYTDNGSGSAKVVTFTATPDQTVMEYHTASWITVSINQTTNEVSIYPSANTSDERSAIVVLSCPNAPDLNIYVTQAECPQIFTLNVSSLSFDDAEYGSGDAQVITLTVNPDQTFTQANTIPWATIVLDQGANTVTVYPTAANTSYERTGTVTLSCPRAADIIINVTQAAGQVFVADKSALYFDYDVSGAAYAQDVNLTIIPDAMFSGVTSGLSWATVTYNNAQNKVTVYPNSQNTGVDRTGTITLSCTGAPDIVINVTQYGAA
jgi:hypothetical protein